MPDVSSREKKSNSTGLLFCVKDFAKLCIILISRDVGVSIPILETEKKRNYANKKTD